MTEGTREDAAARAALLGSGRGGGGADLRDHGVEEGALFGRGGGFAEEGGRLGQGALEGAAAALLEVAAGGA